MANVVPSYGNSCPWKSSMWLFTLLAGLCCIRGQQSWGLRFSHGLGGRHCNCLLWWFQMTHMLNLGNSLRQGISCISKFERHVLMRMGVVFDFRPISGILSTTLSSCTRHDGSININIARKWSSSSSCQWDACLRQEPQRTRRSYQWGYVNFVFRSVSFILSITLRGRNLHGRQERTLCDVVISGYGGTRWTATSPDRKSPSPIWGVSWFRYPSCMNHSITNYSSQARAPRWQVWHHTTQVDIGSADTDRY